MSKSNLISGKVDVKTAKSSKQISRFQNGFLKNTIKIFSSHDEDKWTSSETSRMINLKWSSRTSNDSAFCSTETGIIDSSYLLEDDDRDHQSSDLSLNRDVGSFSGNPNMRIESIKNIEDISKSTEELSQSRLSIDGSSCTSLSYQIGNSLLSITSKKASLENISSSTSRNKSFVRSTSFETDEAHFSFRRKLRNIKRITKQKFKETPRSEGSPSSSSVNSSELDEYEIWASKGFLNGRDSDFQVKQADVFLKVRLVSKDSRGNRSDLKTAVMIPSKIDTSDNLRSDYQKCLIQSKVNMQCKPMHLFLFEDLLIIAKQRFMGMSHLFRIKERLSLILLWMTCDQLHPNLPIPNQSLVTFGWSQKHIKNCSVAFETLQDKLLWMKTFHKQQELVAKSYEEELLIKVYCDDRNHGNRTKKIVVKRTETIDDIMEKVPAEFFPDASRDSQFQFSLKYFGDSDKYFLSGSENLYAIQLSSNKKLLSSEVEYFSIVPMKSGSFLKKSQSCKTSKQIAISEVSPELATVDNFIIGRNLQEVFQDHHGKLPKVVYNLLKLLYDHGPQVDGIFRKSSNQKEVQLAMEKLCGGERESLILDLKPCVASSVLKLWLKNMPDCLLVSEKYSGWLEAVQLEESQRIQKIKTLVDQLPPENRLVLQHLVCVLRRVADNSDENKMTPHNLAVCLGPSILSSSIFADYETEADSRKSANIVVETMIEHVSEIFGENQCIDLFPEAGICPQQKSDGMSNGELAQEHSSSFDSIHDYSATSDLPTTPEEINFRQITEAQSAVVTQNDDSNDNSEILQRSHLDANKSNASERKQNFASAIRRNDQECPEIIPEKPSNPVKRCTSLSSNPPLSYFTNARKSLNNQLQQCRNVPRLIPRRSETMPHPATFSSNCISNFNKGNSTNANPRYIVEVFINPSEDSNHAESRNKTSYQQSTNTSQEPLSLDTRNNAMCRTSRFNTTIYLRGPERTSYIEEPPRLPKSHFPHNKLKPLPNLIHPRSLQKLSPNLSYKNNTLARINCHY